MMGCTCLYGVGKLLVEKADVACPRHGKELWAKIEDMAPRLWSQIAADGEPLLEGLSWKERLEGMVELVLDANRPEQFGLMTKDEYQALLELPEGLANKWAAKSLKAYV